MSTLLLCFHLTFHPALVCYLLLCGLSTLVLLIYCIFFLLANLLQQYGVIL